ncbi:stalk domain-containing protein [Peptoniphilus vaginalis]|uniref:stalk domain-containing protein n=1 Tax=Peptoniphilus vaginalis TaxID=1756987 RepID=UPI0023F99E6E|nr:stalk domain-containing protein [Peptoniphilus vaginalis]
MNDLGDKSGVESGKIKEIKEFGGWTAIDGGKFAIAKKTQYGFFPIGTINVTRVGGKKGGAETAFVQESVLDKTNDYTLLLGKAVTGANKDEPAHDGTKYKHTGEGLQIARNVKGFNGIEKTFKAYSPATGSKVKVGFKIGYTGDIDGKKAKYKVEVLAHEGDSWTEVYGEAFDPTKNEFDPEDKVSKVTPAKDGNVSAFNVTGMTKDQAEEKMNTFNIVPNGTVGTFLSKEIQLPKGATEYKVKISIADQDRLGMSYQSKFELYALPISGADFNIDQDTKQLAKFLFTQIYNKLLEEKAEDIKNKTPESIAAYEAELEKMKALVDSTELNSKADYVTSLEKVEQTHKNLVSPVLDLVAPTTKVAVKNPAQLTEQEKQAVKDAVKDANKGLNLDDKDITVDNDGKVTVKKGDKTGTIEAGNVVEESKVLDLVAPTKKVAVKNPAQLTEQEKQAVKDAVKDANQGLNLDDNDITVDNDGKVTVKKGDKTGTIEGTSVVEESKVLDLVAPTTKVAVKNPAQLTEQEKQAVKKAVKDANQGLNLDDNDITVDNDGKVTVKKGDKTGTIEGTSVVEESKVLDLVAPTTKVAVKNPAQLTEQEKQAVKDAIKAANQSLNLTDNDIEVKNDGSTEVTKNGITTILPAFKVLKEALNQDNESQDSYIQGYGDYFPGGIKIKEYSTPTHPVIVSIPKKSEELVKGKGESLWYVFHIDKLEYDVVTNGVTTKRTMDITPIISKGRTMVPLRYVAEVIGAEVKWDAKTRTASFTKDGVTASIQIDGDEIVLSNGKTIKMDSKPLIVKDRMLVSVVNLANVFGLTNGNEKDKKDQDIEWNHEVRTVTVYVKR